MIIVFILLVLTNISIKFLQETNYLLSDEIIADLSSPGISDITFHVYDGLGMLSLGYGISSFFAGLLSDQLGNKNIFIASFILVISATFGIFYSCDVFDMKWLRLLLGLGMGSINCCSYTQMKMISSDTDFAASVNRNYFIVFASAIVAPVISIIITQSFGWRYIFGLSGIILILLFFSILYSVPNTIQYHTKASYTQAIIELISQPKLHRCFIIASLTIGQAYCLQSLAAQFQEYNEVFIDKSQLSMIGRLIMCIMVFISGYFLSIPLSILSHLSISIVAFAMMLLVYSVAYACPMLFVLGFILSYAGIGIGQPAIKAEALILGATLPGITQGLMSVAGAFWEWSFNKMLCSLVWPYGVYLGAVFVLFGVYCAQRVK